MSDERDTLAAILAYRTHLPVRVAQHGAAADQLGITVVPAQTRATIDESGRWALAAGTGATQPGNTLLLSSARRTPTVAVILTAR